MHFTRSKKTKRISSLSISRRSAAACPAWIEPLEARQLLNAGGPDKSLGRDGTVTVTSLPASAAVAVQSDGKIVVAETVNNDFAVTRFNYDGSLDTTFGTGGTVTTALGGTDTVSGVAIDGKGRIVVVGTAVGVGTLADSTGDFALVRYTASGGLDRHFGDSGIVLTTFGGSDVANAVFISPGNSIYVAGSKDQDNGQRDFAVVRYGAAGEIDTTFGTGGVVVTDLGGDDVASAVDVSSTQVVVAGVSNANDLSDFAVVRYNLQGQLDTTFNGNGMAFALVASAQQPDTVGGVIIQSNGKIVVGGESAGVGTLFRFNANGTPDTSFGVSGTGEADFNSAVANPDGVTSGISSLAVESDGKILAGGFLTDDTQTKFAIGRFSANGIVDSTFGVVTPPGEQDLATSAFSDGGGIAGIALSPDGKIVAAGGSTQLDVARYNNDVSGSDSVRPIAALTSATKLRRATNRGYTFTVTYTDNVAVNAATLGNGNIVVTGPHRFDSAATFVSASPSKNDPTIVATYSVAAPSGGFTSSANGTYTVQLEARQVEDTNGDSATAATLGTFTVKIPAAPALAAMIPAALPMGAPMSMAVAPMSELFDD